MKSIAFSSLLIFVLDLVVGCVGESRVTAPEPATTATSQPAQDAAQDNSAVPNVAGNWQASSTAADGSPQQGSLQIKQNGSKLSGTFQGPRGSTSLQGSLKGNQISLTIVSPKRHVSLTGTVDGDKMSGTTDQGVSWTATRE